MSIKEKIVGIINNKYIFVLAVAVIVGFLSVLPQLLLINAAGDSYRGIIYADSNDDYSYLAMIHEVTDGHWLVGSPFYFEYKGTFPVVLPFVQYIYAFPTLLFGISLTNFLLFSKFLFPAILFFLVYLLINKLSNQPQLFASRINAAAGGCLVTLGYDLVDYKNSFTLIFNPSFFNAIVWTRPIYPVSGAIFLFIIFFISWKFLEKEKINYPIILLAAGTQVLLFTYIFSWGIAVSVLCLLMVISFIRKKSRIAWNFFITLFVGFLLLLPLLFSVVLQLADSPGLSRRYGLYFNHNPFFNKLLLLAVVIYGLSFVCELIKKRKINQPLDDWWFFCLSLLAGTFFAYNQQIITGRTIWPYHFVQFSIPIVFVVFQIFLFNKIKPKFKIVWQGIVIIIFFLTLILGIRSGLSYRYAINDFIEIQRYHGILSWLNSNAYRDCVVLTTNSELLNLIPAYTPCNLYLSNWVVSGVPMERVYFNYYVALRLKNVAADDIENYLSAHPDEIRYTFFSDWDQLYSISKDDSWIAETAKKIAAGYKDFLQQDFTGELNTYRLDYLAVGAKTKNVVDQFFPEALLIGDFNGILLYQWK